MLLGVEDRMQFQERGNPLPSPVSMHSRIPLDYWSRCVAYSQKT